MCVTKVCNMNHRVNIMLEEQVWQSLQEIPEGERNQFISMAIKERLLNIKRRSVAKKMDQIRERLKFMDNNIDAIEVLRQDRMRDI